MNIAANMTETVDPHRCRDCGQDGGPQVVITDGDQVEHWHIDCSIRSLDRHTPDWEAHRR